MMDSVPTDRRSRDPSAAVPSSVPTLTAALRRAAGGEQRGVSVLDRTEAASRRTWAEIHANSRVVASGLHRLGIESGSRVALIYPTGFEFIEAFFGCLLAGAVPVPMYPPVRLGRLSEYHRRTAAMFDAVSGSLMLCDSRIRRLLGETVVQVRPPLGCRTLAELPAGSQSATATDEHDLCLIQFSSGTTVDPKPVALTHRAVMSQITALNGFWPDSQAVRHSGVSWLPLYHDMGLIGCLCAAVERPGDLMLIPPELFIAQPAVWLRTLSRTRATISPSPNFGFGLCVEKIRDDELAGVDLSSWTVALNGAETVVASVARAFCSRFASWGFRREAMTPVYGLSEAALAVTFSDIDRPFTACRFSSADLAAKDRAREDPTGIELVSVGRPLPGCSISIRDESGSEVESGRAGRIWVRSPSLMSRYFGNQPATDEAIRGGWLDTGDLGFLYEGELFLSGRVKDILILRGRNYRPEDVEHAVDSVVGVRTGCSAAVGYLPRGAAGEVLLVFVEKRRRSQRNGGRDIWLAERCERAILAATGLEPHQVVVLEPGTLPRTSSGKIRRHEALQLFLTDRLRPPRAGQPLRLLAALARSHRAFRTLKRSAAVEEEP